LGTLVYPLLLVFSMWAVLWIEVRFRINLNFLGVYPHRLDGLHGIVTAPFVHSGLEHLFNNSVPLLVLSMALFYFYRNIAWRVLLFGTILTGISTWLIGRPALHIGASGVVYMLVAFLFFKGIFSKQYQLIAIAFIVVFLYGSLLWYVFPIDPKISWEGHLSGFAVGLLFSLLFRSPPLPKRTYAWEATDYNPEEDEFMRHFDEEGNFIETISEDEENVEEKVDIPKRWVLRYQITKEPEKPEDTN